VAVLDTGIAYTTRQQKKDLKNYADRIRAGFSFIAGESTADAFNDESGHGTAVAVQVMRTCPTAEVYICRVAKKDQEGMWVVDKGAVAQAIRKAADRAPGGLGVDIINMSFGWDYEDDEVSKALKFARDKETLLFASTSNDGLRVQSMLYPARADEVISIDAADENGTPAGFNPSSSFGRERFTAPGIGITSPGCDELLKGTSFSSPIAAGIAALVLEFARQFPLSASPTVSDHLRKRRGMVLVLKKMTIAGPGNQFHFLCPWDLLVGPSWEGHGGDGQPGSTRYLVAHQIVSCLRADFGPIVGHEIQTAHQP
jgi:subtilisin family serine protease